MPWWVEPWTPTDHAAMRALMAALKKGKPRGWSVVMGDNEFVLRPADRGLGRFGIRRSGGTLRIAFHDRALNHWNGRHEVPADDPRAAAALLSWARQSAAAAEGGRSGGREAAASPIPGPSERGRPVEG